MAKLDAKTVVWLSVCMLYANAFRPLGVYPALSLLVDGIAIFFVLKHVFTKKIKKKIFPIIFVLSLFIFISFFEMFNPNIPSLKAGLEGFRKTALPFVMFYVGVFSLENSEDVPKVLRKISFYSLPILMYGVKQYFFPSTFDKLFMQANKADMYTGMLFGQFRATSIFSGAFHLGIFSAVLAIVNIFLFELARNKRDKNIALLASIISAVSCYVSLTRTNLIPLVAGVIVYKVVQSSRKNSLVLAPVIFVGFITLTNYITNIASSLLYSENPLLRMIGTIANVSDDTRFLGRKSGWKEVGELILVQPLAAYGTGSAGDTMQYSYDFNYHVTSHNFFLKILMETGVIGLFLMVVFFISVLFVLLRKIQKNAISLNIKIAAMCLGILAVFGINAMVGSTIETNPASNLIMLILGFGVTNLKISEPNELVKIVTKPKRKRIVFVTKKKNHKRLEP